MAQRYEIKAKGAGGTSYRVELHDSTYGGSTVTELGADEGFLEVVGGSDEHTGEDPVWGKEIRVRVLTTEDLSPLYGLRDRDVEVRVYDIDTSTLAYKGYLLTDFLTDNPWSQKRKVELRAADGLKTLEGDNFGVLGYASDAAPSTIIIDTLTTLYSNSLDVEIGTEWYPSSGGALGSSDNPLANVKIDPENYREDRPEGSYYNRLEVLEDICESQGLVIRQARVDGELVWAVHQRTAKEGGSIKTWRYAPDGTLRNSPVTRDITKTIDAPIEFEPTREFERRVQSVSVTHDHTDLQQLLLEGGFEDGGTEWGLFDESGYDTLIKNHDNIGPTPGATSQNQQALVVNHTGNPSSNSLDSVAIQSGLQGFSELPHGSYGSLSLKHTWQNIAAGRILLNVGSHYLTEFSAEVREDTLKGKGSIPINPLDRPIPEGTRVPIASTSSNPGPPVKASVELSERAPEGADELVGDLNADVSAGDYAFYAGFKNTNEHLYLPAWFESTQWKKRDIYFSLQDGNGDQVSGTAELHLQFYHAVRNTSNFPKLFWDDIGLGIYSADGSAINSTTKTATVPEFGTNRSLTVRTGSGPTQTNIAALQGDGFKATGWGIGAGGGSHSLAGLNARERLRHSRNHLQRLKLTALARETGLTIEGHEVIELDGKSYTVSAVDTRPDDGRVSLTLLELNDHGTTDLEIQTTRKTDGQSSASSGTATGGVGQTVGWEDLSGKPPWVDLLSTNGDGDLAIDEDLRATGEVEAFADGSGSSSTAHSELQILDDGSTETMDAKSLNIQGASVTESGGDVTLDLTDLGGGGTDFQAGNLLSLNSGTLDVHSEVPRMDLDEEVTGRWHFNPDNVSDGEAYFRINGHRNLSFVRRGSDVSSADISIESSANNAITFRDQNANVAMEVNVSDGRVGIGTSDPISALDVSGGEIRNVSEFNVSTITSNNGNAAIHIGQPVRIDSDYGSNEDYTLRVDGKIESNENPDEFLEWSTDSVLSGDQTFTFQLDPNDSRASGQFYYEIGGSRVFEMRKNGNTIAQGEVEAFDSSDKRLKENLTSVDNPLSTIDKLTGYHFDWNEEAQDYKPESGYGLVAQEVQEVMPEAVRENGDGYLGLQYEQLHALEVEAIKHLKARIEEIESKLED